MLYNIDTISSSYVKYKLHCKKARDLIAINICSWKKNTIIQETIIIVTLLRIEKLHSLRVIAGIARYVIGVHGSRGRTWAEHEYTRNSNENIFLLLYSENGWAVRFEIDC